MAVLTKYENFCMLFGTKPSRIVALETKMIANVLDHLLLKRDSVRQTVQFPQVLEQVKSDDASFELAVSNSIQKLTLYHRSSPFKNRYNYTVRKSIGIVFINTKTLGLDYDLKLIEKRKKNVIGRMSNVWKVDDLRVFEDLTKSEIVKQFELLQNEANQFV